MQSKTYFEKSLCESARLFSLCKNQMDLFLLSQAGIITYQQLAYCRLHGKTEAAGRLSLKALENDDLVQAKRLPNQYLSKYYFLTPKGRALLRSLFPAALLDYLQITLERRLPTGTQQIYHRIRTNDFYFAYIASPNSRPVLWIPEPRLLPSSIPGKDAPPRCGGLLLTSHTKYYTEQDDNTQSESILHQKLRHYQQAGILVEKSSGNILVFCLAFPRKCAPAAKPSFLCIMCFCIFQKYLTQTSHIKNGIRTLKNQYFNL